MTLDRRQFLKLSALGESIRLTTASGLVLDTVSFGSQANDVSQGRFSDGGGTIHVLSKPTPGAPNVRDPEGPTAPRFTEVSRLNAQRVYLKWTAIPGRNYRVDHKATLDAAEWEALGAPLQSVEESLSLTDTLDANAQRFYRVILLN